MTCQTWEDPPKYAWHFCRNVFPLGAVDFPLWEDGPIEGPKCVWCGFTSGSIVDYTFDTFEPDVDPACPFCRALYLPECSGTRLDDSNRANPGPNVGECGCG